MFALISPTVWASFALSLFLSFGSGYALHAYRAKLTEAGQAATIETVTKTITVTDKAAVSRLQAQLAAAKDKATALETLINESRNANPVPSDDCRLPERVLSALNADLAEGAR